MAEWLKHQTVNLGYVGSSPTVPANIKLMQQINTYAELRKLKLNKLFKHPTYNIYQVIKNRNAGFCQGGFSNINQCGFMYRTSFNKPFCYRACVQGKQYFWYIKIKYRIILDDK